MPGEDRREMEEEDNVWRLLSRWITPRRRDALARGELPVPRPGGARMAARRVLHRRRRGAPAAAIHRPGHVPGRARRGESRLEAAAVLSRPGRRRAARHLCRSSAREHVMRLTSIIKDIGRADLRARSGGRARSRRQIACGCRRPNPHAAAPAPDSADRARDSCLRCRHPANGTIFPQPRVKCGNELSLLDDLTGTGLRVVADGGLDLAPLVDNDTVRQLGIKLVQVNSADRTAPATRLGGQLVSVVETEGVLARWFDRHECRAAIVRPDNYVFGVATTQEDVLNQIASLRSAYEPAVNTVMEES